MKIILRQTHHTIADFDSIFADIRKDLSLEGSDKELFIYPELYLTGYPLQDLVLQREFIERYLNNLNNLDRDLKDMKII